MKIVNLIHIGDEVRNLDDMSPEERKRIAIILNTQALKPLYRYTLCNDNIFGGNARYYQ